MNDDLENMRKAIANDIDALAAGQRDERIKLRVLDTIIALQQLPGATDADVHITSELYAFIVDSDQGVVHSELRTWAQAQKSASQLRALADAGS